MTEKTVYVLYTAFSGQPIGVFSSKELAGKFCLQNDLWGTVLRYELDLPLVDWVGERVNLGTKFDRRNPLEIAKFSSMYPIVLEITNTDDEKLVVDRDIQKVFSFDEYAVHVGVAT